MERRCHTELSTSLSKQEGVLSTHSYGFNTGWTLNNSGTWNWGGDKNVSPTIDYRFGYYSEYDQTIDLTLLSAPWHTLVRSAGNHRGDGPATPTAELPQERDGGATGYDCVSFGSLPKNNLPLMLAPTNLLH